MFSSLIKILVALTISIEGLKAETPKQYEDNIFFYRFKDS